MVTIHYKVVSTHSSHFHEQSQIFTMSMINDQDMFREIDDLCCSYSMDHDAAAPQPSNNIFRL